MEENAFERIKQIFEKYRLKSAIFDLDGTLLDTMDIWQRLGSMYITSLGKIPEEGLDEILAPMSLEESCGYLKTRYCFDMSEVEIRLGLTALLERFYREEAKLKSGASELLNGLSKLGIIMAAATSGDRKLASAALERLGISDRFKALLTCSELGTSKQEPKIYYFATEILGTSPCETAVFEDALYAVETAGKAGFFTFAVHDASNEAETDKIYEACRVYLGNGFFVRFERKL